VLCLALAVPNAVEAGAPSVLYGKSRVVTTNETRISRPVGGPEAAASAHSVLSIYVSAAGVSLRRRSGTDRKQAACARMTCVVPVRTDTLHFTSTPI